MQLKELSPKFEIKLKSRQNTTMLEDMVRLALLLCISTGSAFVFPNAALRPTQKFLGSCPFCSRTLIRNDPTLRVQTGRSKIYAYRALDQSSTAHDVIERFGTDLKGKTALVTG